MLQKASLPSIGFPCTSTNTHHRGRKKEPCTMHEITIYPDETIFDAPLDMLKHYENGAPVRISDIRLIDNGLSPLVGTLTYGDKSQEVDLSPGEETRYFLHFLYTQGYRIVDTEYEEEVFNVEHWGEQESVTGVLEVGSLMLQKQ